MGVMYALQITKGLHAIPALVSGGERHAIFVPIILRDQHVTPALMVGKGLYVTTARPVTRESPVIFQLVILGSLVCLQVHSQWAVRMGKSIVVPVNILHMR